MWLVLETSSGECNNSRYLRGIKLKIKLLSQVCALFWH
jgi:hypothetical protein